METITTNEVVDGDVILYHGNSLISSLIRLFDGTEVNHAGIYLGHDQVGEAMAKGLTRENIADSIKGSEYVIVQRLKAYPDTMKPVIDKAGYYLEIGNKYAYEQILLLAFLGLARKLPVNAYLKWLLRKILDQAADLLTSHGDKQPMICSEFVYRCYDEALPGTYDPYSLEIERFPAAIRKEGTRTRSLSKSAQYKNIQRDSLLAWAGDVMSNRSKFASSVLLSSLEEGTTRKMEKSALADADEKKLSAMSLDNLIKSYIKETRKPASRSLEAQSSLRSPEMLGSIKKFSEALYSVTKPPKSRVTKSWSAKGAQKQIPTTLDHLFKTVADFVTPGDLYTKCDNLYSVGMIVARA
jgi:hypothetical protein